MNAVLPSDIRRAAMDLLARREHSVGELQTKLRRRFDDSDLITEQLRRLTEEGLQSDSRYASSYLHARAQRGFGPLRIRQELEQRGVGCADIEAAMDNCELNWRALAGEVLRKKYGADSAADFPEKARRARFLQYRGFPSELVMSVQEVGD